MQWVQLNRLKQALKCNDTYIFISSCVPHIRLSDAHLKLECSVFVLFDFYFKVPLLWIMKGSYFGFGSPQQQVDMHAIIYNMHLFLPCFAQRLPNDSFNDSFFQTPPVRDADLL